MKENKIEELKERLEELHRIQEARLACNADDLDIREEIAEVEEEIKELEYDINEENNNGRRHKCRRHRKQYRRRYKNIGRIKNSK